MRERREFIKACAISSALAGPLVGAEAGAVGQRILIVVGPSNHPPGTHEVAAGGRLLKHCLDSIEEIDLAVDLFYDWPTEDSVLDNAKTVVFIGDTFPLNRMPDAEAKLARMDAMTKRGCGVVCVHYATGLRAEDVAADGEHPLLHWMGGYFATRCPHHQSVAKVFQQATITPAEPRHPIWRGCGQYTLHDEPYINNFFGKQANRPAENVTALATSMLPPEDPKPETVAWCVERPDGGRGFGVVMPHFYKNWKIDSLRGFILNGIVWSAGCEVPATGVRTRLPDLASFEPASVEPVPRPSKS